jgi:hypothetical protein
MKLQPTGSGTWDFFPAGTGKVNLSGASKAMALRPPPSLQFLQAAASSGTGVHVSLDNFDESKVRWQGEGTWGCFPQRVCGFAYGPRQREV